MESLRQHRDELCFEIARPVRHEPAWTTAFAQLQRAYQMPEFDLELRADVVADAVLRPHRTPNLPGDEDGAHIVRDIAEGARHERNGRRVIPVGTVTSRFAHGAAPLAMAPA